MLSEIRLKILQGIAKILTLNTQSFTKTRLSLSESWDKLKELDKERKKVRAQQRQVSKENSEGLQKEISDLNLKLAEKQINIHEASRKVDEINHQMRYTDLDKDDLRLLRDELNDLRKSIQDVIKAGEDDRLKQEIERDRLKKEKVITVRQEIEAVLSHVDSYEADALQTKRETFMEAISSLQITKSEKQDLERLLKPLRDIISEKKERALLSLSEDDRETLQQLKVILKQRKERRQEIKSQIEILRKSAGSSGWDFTQAMKFTEQLNSENACLDKANEGIKEIELKINHLEQRGTAA